MQSDITFNFASANLATRLSVATFEGAQASTFISNTKISLLLLLPNNLLYILHAQETLDYPRHPTLPTVFLLPVALLVEIIYHSLLLSFTRNACN